MISEINRRNIFDALRVQKINWAGQLDEPNFLSRIFNLSEMDSTDYRFSNADGDIWQHRINNFDWEDDWIFTDKRFNLLRCEDEIFLRFLCEMIHPIVRSDVVESEKLRQLFNDFLAEEGFEIIERSKIGGYPVYAARRKIDGIPLGMNFVKNKEDFNAEYLSRQINRIESAVLYDPDLAIGTTKELVETCCKTILGERGISYEESWDIAKLVKETNKQLKLTPDDISETSKGAETIKRLLSNLASVTQGLAELRNAYGTGHGKHSRSKGLSSRHAKLAAGAGTALAIFLFETHQERGEIDKQ